MIACRALLLPAGRLALPCLACQRTGIIVTVTDAQRGESTPAIRHVMFDADGVLQNLPGGWIAAAEFGVTAPVGDVYRAIWLGMEPAAILFIDDSAQNVTAARIAGLAAEQWCLDDGHDVLLDLLGRNGVTGP